MNICNFFPQSPFLVVSFLQDSLPQPDVQFSYMCVTCLTCNHPWFYHSHDICWEVQIMKLLIMQSFPPSCYPSPVGPNSFISTLFSHTFSLYISQNVTDQVSHPYKRGRKIQFFIMETSNHCNTGTLFLMDNEYFNHYAFIYKMGRRFWTY